MRGDESCTHWDELAIQAQAEAEQHRPDTAAQEEIRRALERARARLGGESVRGHRVRFDPDAWQFDGTDLPGPVLESRCVTRGDGFDLAAQPATAAANWQLFCLTFVFGYGLSGLGPVRFRKITSRTPPERLCTVIAEARRRLTTCGPMSAYDYLRGSDTRSTVPGLGPAFITKLLYFADPSGTGLILDTQLARIVQRLSGMQHFAVRGQWSRWTAYRYGVYLAWMRLVADQQHVRPDFLEYALFSEGRQR